MPNWLFAALALFAVVLLVGGLVGLLPVARQGHPIATARRFIQRARVRLRPDPLTKLIEHRSGCPKKRSRLETFPLKRPDGVRVRVARCNDCGAAAYTHGDAAEEPPALDDPPRRDDRRELAARLSNFAEEIAGYVEERAARRAETIEGNVRQVHSLSEPLTVPEEALPEKLGEYYDRGTRVEYALVFRGMALGLFAEACALGVVAAELRERVAKPGDELSKLPKLFRTLAERVAK